MKSLPMNIMTAHRLLSETIKGSPRVKHPVKLISHCEYVSDTIGETIRTIREKGGYIPVDEGEMRCAGLLHDIGYCFAENPYLHPIIGGEFLRKRGLPRIARIIETHTYTPESIMYIGYKRNTNPDHWIPDTWDQVLIDYASLISGRPDERITPDEKFKRFREKRNAIFQRMIDHAEPRLRQEVGDVELLLLGRKDGFREYRILEEIKEK